MHSDSLFEARPIFLDLEVRLSGVEEWCDQREESTTLLYIIQSRWLATNPFQRPDWSCSIKLLQVQVVASILAQTQLKIEIFIIDIFLRCATKLCRRLRTFDSSKSVFQLSYEPFCLWTLKASSVITNSFETSRQSVHRNEIFSLLGDAPHQPLHIFDQAIGIRLLRLISCRAPWE